MVLYCCCCLALVLVNVVVMIIGLIFAALGGLLIWGMPTIIGFVSGMTAELKDILKVIGVEMSIEEIMQFLAQSISSVGAAFLVLGIVFFAIAIIAYVGLCCRSVCILWIYVGILGTILLVQVIVAIVFAARKNLIFDGIRTGLLESIKTEYKGDRATDFVSVAWNLLQIFYGCCGVTNGDDFALAENWQKSYWATVNGVNQTFQLTYPSSCCKRPTGSWMPTNLQMCISHNSVNSSNSGTGCVAKLESDAMQYFDLVLSIFGGIIAVQAIFIGLAILTTCLLKVEKAIVPV